MGPWSKVDYSRHIREASMEMEGLLEVNPPSGRVPELLLRLLRSEKRRWRTNSRFSAAINFFSRVSVARGLYRRKEGLGGHPLVPPFDLYLHPVLETLGTKPFTRHLPLLLRRRDSKIGTTRQTCPGTLPERGLTSESFSTTMSASRMCRE